VISQLASAFHQGMQEAGMASTGKHFPGHGSVVVDSHLGLPIDERAFATIEKEDMVPFASLIKNNMQGILASHILFPEIDNKPAGYSKIWLQDILRNRLGFHGTIFSDCLSMEGANISANYTDRVLAAREAGCNFTLLCNQRKGVIEVLDNIAYQSHMVSEDKWGGFIGRFQGMQPIKENKRWRDAHDFIATLTQENVV
jgi:beta-N-acetylhexosaminidase